MTALFPSAVVIKCMKPVTNRMIEGGDQVGRREEGPFHSWCERVLHVEGHRQCDRAEEREVNVEACRDHEGK